LTSKVFRRFKRLIAINDRMADLFRRYGVADERIVIIPPYSLRSPDENITIPAELKNFYERHSPVLLAVGGLEKDYQPLFLVEAMKSILTEFPKAGLMIAGGGSMHAETEAAAVETGYSSAICLAGDVEHAITLHLIKDADVVLRTTLFDGDAISAREALFLGTPVVATDNGSRPAGV
jgi:glycosyltransferase involved in cell wall biosynthesis